MFTREDAERELLSRAESDESFRALLLENPRDAVRQVFDVEVPSQVTLNVHVEDATSLHLVIPLSPRLTDKELASISGGDDLHGFLDTW